MSEIKCSPFQIMHIKGRKKPCLFVFEEPNKYKMVASFRDQECADMFAKRFNEIIDEVFWNGVRVSDK